MTRSLRNAVRAATVVAGVSFALSMMAGSASAWWAHGCFGCGRVVVGGVAAAAIARPLYVPPVYYGAPAVYPVAPVYRPYPVCPAYVNPWYCR